MLLENSNAAVRNFAAKSTFGKYQSSIRSVQVFFFFFFFLLSLFILAPMLVITVNSISSHPQRVVTLFYSSDAMQPAALTFVYLRCKKHAVIFLFL